LQVVLLSSMRGLLSVALVVTLSRLANGEFRGPIGEIFNTWDPSKDVIYVKDFDHLAPLFAEKEVHQEEHIRKKRNAAEAAHYLANYNPITKACDRPGYTGQYCEFPICLETNPSANPQQFKLGDGYLFDVADMGNCTKVHEIIVDESMFDIRIELQSYDNVNPRIVVTDEAGYIGEPDGNIKEANRHEAYFARMKPGYYRVTASADSIDSRCLLQSSTQTGMTISGGFSSDERDRNDYPNRNAAAHQFNSIMLHLNGARSPAEIKTISVIGVNNYMFRPRILDKRYGCTYEYYFDSMFCMTPGEYAMIVEGIDFNGNPFRRAANFGCLPSGPDPTKAPITTTKPVIPTQCSNGGVLLSSATGPATCICQDHWTGPQCEKPLCINGGTLLEGKCFCPIGFAGDHCEEVRCEPNSDHGFGVDRPTLVLVVRVREQNNEVMEQVWNAVDQVAENLQFDADYFSRFQVVYFNDYTNFASKSYKSIREFDSDFMKATISGHTDGQCTDAVIGAVATGLTNLALTANSYIYVITDAVADDYSTMTDTLMQYNSYFKATINFLYVDPVPESNCQADVSDPGFRAFENIANSFGGLAMHIDDRTKVYDLFYNHLNSIIYKSQLMLTVDREECSKGLVKAVHIEKKNENLVIIGKGRLFMPFVTSPEGVYLTEDQLETVVKQDYVTIWRVKDPIPGQYIIRATTNPPTAACNFRAYQASYQTAGPPQAEAFWTITTDVDQDGGMYQPMSGMDNNPIFHVENLGEQEDWDHAFAFLNMYTWRDGQEKEVYASNGLWRGGCAYNFYFPSFQCRPNEKLHYEFFVRNDEGFYIQRAGVMDCYTFVPTLSPPSDCLNGGVMYNDTCLCQAHFTGDKCSTVVCDNGGTPGFMNSCMCTKGWGGPFCSYAICDEPGPVPTFGYHVDMAFLVEVTKKGVGQIKQLAAVLPGLLRDISSQHKEWIDRVVLIGYDSEKVLGMVDAPMGSPGKIYDALDAWGNSNPTDDKCVVRVWEAMNTLLRDRMDGPNQRKLPRRSIVNIFEANLPDNNVDILQIMTTSEELLETNALTNVFQWRDSTTATGWTCGGQQSDMVYLEQVARRGDGKMYTLAYEDVSDILRMVPTLFSSSIVYKFHSEDCTAEQFIYFPIDAYTQTVSAIVAGFQATVDLYRYNGAKFNKDGRVPIYRNDFEQIVEYRNPCASDWESISQYCMYFSPARTMVKTFTAANDFCKSVGSFLADDLSAEKNQFFVDNMAGQTFWLGLQYTTDKGWAFQHDDGSMVPVPANVNYWSGGVVPSGANGRVCAYFDPKSTNGYWYDSDCTGTYHTVCQKHMYEIGQGPSSIEDDDLSPGKYYLSVTTDPANGWRGCDVEVRVQSDLNVEFGFVDGLRKDNPHPVANVDSNNNRVVSSISIGQGKTDLSILQQVMLRSDTNQNVLLEAATYSYRFACSYEYYSQPLNCDLTNGEDFSVIHIGEDDTGNTFQRYSTSLCYKWNVCFNDGIYSNGECLCSDYWTGDSCRTPHCQNNGKLNSDGISCTCESGYGGPVCQFVQCDVNSNTKINDGGRMLALVIEKSENTAAALQQIADNFTSIVAAINDRNSQWITSYALHAFTLSGDIDDPLAVYKDVDDFVTHLNQIAQESATMMGSCQQPMWDAMHGLFNDMGSFLSGGEVLIITASAPLDADIDSIHATMELFDSNSPRVDFIHIETPQCQEGDWVRDLEEFYFFFQNSGGTMFRTQPDQIGEGLEMFLPTRYAATKLSFQDPGACQQATVYIQVDTRMRDVFIMLGGSAASVSVINPLNNPVMVDVVYRSDLQTIWKVSGGPPGVYSVTTSSNSQMCFPTIYGYGGAEVFFGFVQDFNTGDKPLPYAVYGKVNFPVFYLYDRNTTGQSNTETLYMANTYVQSFYGKVGKSYDTDIDMRSGCSYSYIGSRGFTCTDKDEVISMAVSGVDDYNQPFNREAVSWCKSVTPPPATTTVKPPVTGTTTVPTTTPAPTPKTIQFDVLFIVDETEDETFLPEIAEKFIESTMEIFTPSQKKARVGLITMPNKASKSMPVAFLSSIDSFEALDQDLLSLEDFNIPGEKEYLVQALQFANDPNKYKKKENGYRVEVVNHVIVILTAKNKIDDIDGAVTEIANIARDASYGVIAIGYGNQADWSDIKKLGGECTQIAATKDDLMLNSVDFVQTQIWNATFNGGIYC
ncbi:hypothetical protein PFISCL1PPCAC_14832, partial [Pristionchus fissidentatus]